MGALPGVLGWGVYELVKPAAHALISARIDAALGAEADAPAAKHQISTGVALLTGGLLPQHGAVAQAAGGAVEAGANAVVSTAVNLAAAGCAVACAGAATAAASMVFTPSAVGAGLYAGGRFLWRSLSGGGGRAAAGAVV